MLYKIAKNGSWISQLLIGLAVVVMAWKFAWDTFIIPYNICVCVVLLGLFLYAVFQQVRKRSGYAVLIPYDIAGLATNNKQLAELMNKLQSEINKFENAVTYYFFGVRTYKYYTVILAALSTIILGFDFAGLKMPYGLDYTKVSKNIALIIGAVITVMSTMAVFWNLEKYWLQNKIILQKFRELKEEIELADKKTPLTPEEADAFSEKYKSIKKDFYKYWEGVQAERSKQ